MNRNSDQYIVFLESELTRYKGIVQSYEAGGRLIGEPTIDEKINAAVTAEKEFGDAWWYVVQAVSGIHRLAGATNGKRNQDMMRVTLNELAGYIEDLDTIIQRQAAYHTLDEGFDEFSSYLKDLREHVKRYITPAIPNPADQRKLNEFLKKHNTRYKELQQQIRGDKRGQTKGNLQPATIFIGREALKIADEIGRRQWTRIGKRLYFKLAHSERKQPGENEAFGILNDCGYDRDGQRLWYRNALSDVIRNAVRSYEKVVKNNFLPLIAP